MQSQLASPGASPDATAVFMKQSQSILSMLDQEEAQLRADNAKSGTEMDPATQFTLDKLRETLETNLQHTKEQLNSRGLLDSGIELELENRLQKGSASDEAMLLGQRMSQLQKDLQTGLSSIRGQRFQAASQFGLAGANAQTATDEQMRKLSQDRDLQAVQDMLNLRGQMNTSDIAEQNRNAEAQRQQAQFGFEGQQGALARAAAQASQQAQFSQQSQQAASTQAAEAQRQAAQLQQQATLAKQAQEAAAKQGDLDRANALQKVALEAQAAANRAAIAAQAAASRQQLISPFQQAQLDLEKQRLAQGGIQQGISRTATDAATAEIQSKFNTVEDAMAAIEGNSSALQQSGVNIQAVRTWVLQNLPSREAGEAGNPLDVR